MMYSGTTARIPKYASRSNISMLFSIQNDRPNALPSGSWVLLGSWLPSSGDVGGAAGGMTSGVFVVSGVSGELELPGVGFPGVDMGAPMCG
jgi:hypothetical protein